MKSSDQIQQQKEFLHWQSRVDKIKEYIDHNLAANLHLAAVATRFGISASTLRHIFKQREHKSYNQYLEERRMQYAWQLLTKENKSIKEIIFASGYKNRAAFNNAFKKRFKHPPRHFRK